MAKRPKYGIPGDLDELLYPGHIKERNWTPRLLSAVLKPLEKKVEDWGVIVDNDPLKDRRFWGEPSDKWRHNPKNRNEWAWMKHTALMVTDCRAALKAKQFKKAVRIYKAIQLRLEKRNTQPLQKQRAAARKGGQQTSEKAQTKRTEVVKLLKSDTKRNSEQIGRMVGLSGSRVRDIKQEWLVELRNRADAMIYSTENTLKEHRDKFAHSYPLFIAPEEVKAIEEAIAETKQAVQGSDPDVINASMEKLTKASHTVNM